MMKSQTPIYALAVSISLLAAALAYFALVLHSAIPMIVDEIRSTRQEIPGYLERVESFVSSVGNAGERAAEGVVVGAVKGTVKAPFSLIAALGASLKGSVKLSQSEEEVIAVAMDNALKSEQPGLIYPFDHPSTELAGEIELLAVDSKPTSPRYSVRIEVHREGKSLFRRKLVLAMDGMGQLKLMESSKL